MIQSNLTMRGLPFTPIDPSWLVESRAFISANAKVVRAAVLMLTRAWEATPAGSLPSDMQRIGVLCGLSDIEVGEHWDVLTEGWEVRDGRLHHVAMSGLAQRVGCRFGDVIERLQDQAAAVIQAPEAFELVAPEVGDRTMGRRLLPAGSELTPELCDWLASHGYADKSDQALLWEEFRTWARKDNQKSNDWEAAFHNFALREDMRKLPSRLQVPVVGSSRAERFGSRGEQAVNHNTIMMNAVHAHAARGPQ